MCFYLLCFVGVETQPLNQKKMVRVSFEKNPFSLLFSSLPLFLPSWLTVSFPHQRGYHIIITNYFHPLFPVLTVDKIIDIKNQKPPLTNKKKSHQLSHLTSNSIGTKQP